MTIDLSPTSHLFEGCDFVQLNEQTGRTTFADATKAVAHATSQLKKQISSMPRSERKACELTGAAPLWLYLPVFSLVSPSFDRVIYTDGRAEQYVVSVR